MNKAAISYELLTIRSRQHGAVYVTMLRFRPTKSEAELLRKEADWEHRVTVADAIADYYDTKVWIPPVFDNQFDERYSVFYADVPIPGKMPDLYFSGKFWEVESYEGHFNPNHFTDMMRDGRKQSPFVIIKLNHEYDIGLLKRRAKGYMHKTNGNRNVGRVIERIIIVDISGRVHEV